MRIGLVLPSTPSYSETFFNNKIKGLIKNGFEVIVFAQTIDPSFKLCRTVKSPKVRINKFLFLLNVICVFFKLLLHPKKLIKYYKLLKNAGFSLTEIFKRIYLNSHILTKNVDWLHFGFTTQAVGSEYVAKALGAKMAVSFRGFDINVFPLKHKNCYKEVWSNIDKVHSISEYLVNKAYKLGLKKNTSISVITPAVDEEVLNKFNPKQSLEPLDSLTICTLARLNWIKDLTTAIKAIKILKVTYPKVNYHIIGDGNIKERERYQFLVKQLGLKENVVFHKKLDHNKALELVSKSNIYLQTSLNEGFCNAVLEAQALGKLCIVSNVGGLKENIINGETGWLVESQRPKLFAKKIIEVIQLTETEKTVISEKAMKRVQEEFMLRTQNLKFNQFYNS
ncbi:glycosyltransferase family 4 protein [Winogradskyella sp.]|jgi:colanic acid/amylovoran biosynthesis glycosyltransferase|uniref:glycosyltransferase family 4 protein n=1 Tax=Winogradskyella sp. TaxID=1883156 RepID=UPI0025E40DE6|nr:glycosyltransferase family 4 protein [Winogradskyella sp.]MCT4628397.1 glycosyltransferase family 4 protein [Winogradskyella sp.]